MYLSAILPAGGSSVRFGSNKLFQPLAGKPLFIYAVLQFLKFTKPCDLVIPVHPDHLTHLRELLAEFVPDGKQICVVPGGPDRTRSVLNALEALSPEAELTAVHDAARPLIREGTIRAVYEAAEAHGAAAAARPVTSTLKKIDGDKLLISGGLKREEIWEIETPQIFRTEILRKALCETVRKNFSFTDDAAAVEAFTGLRTFPVVPGEINLKVTHPSDLALAEAVLNLRSLPQ